MSSFTENAHIKINIFLDAHFPAYECVSSVYLYHSTPAHINRIREDCDMHFARFEWFWRIDGINEWDVDCIRMTFKRNNSMGSTYIASSQWWKISTYCTSMWNCGWNSIRKVTYFHSLGNTRRISTWERCSWYMLMRLPNDDNQPLYDPIV